MREKLRKRRLELGLTQNELADQLNMSRANYGHIERGRHEPSLKQMALISKVLKVKLEINFFKNYCDETYR
ncbi:helix-turn-helix transcriptional regulator [Bacillus sp. FSL W7-1321]